MAGSLNAAEAPVVAWGNLFDGNTTAGDQSLAVATTTDGAYWLNTLATTKAAPDVFYAGSKLFTGSLYDAGTSNASNFALTKTDATGKEEWTIYTNSGDFANSGSAVATADGSLVFFVKGRHTAGMLDEPLCFVDATGKEYKIGGADEINSYAAYVGKASTEGELLWLRKITTVGDATDAVTTATMALDADGNIFIAGKASAELVFENGQGGNVNLTPGASAKGSLFIASLTDEGYYTSSIIAEGENISEAQILGLTYADGKLFCAGTATATEDSKLTFAGAEITVGTEVSPFVAALDANTLKAEWLNSYAMTRIAEKNGPAFQSPALRVVGNTLWLTAIFNGNLADVANETAAINGVQAVQREGLIIKYNAATGAWLAAADSRATFGETALTGYLSALQCADKPETVYVYGYTMNAAKGAFLRAYDASTLTCDAADEWLLASGGGVPTAVAIAYEENEGKAYFTARGNKAFTLLGGAETEAPNGWAVLAAKVDLPDALTSGAAAPEATSLTIAGGRGTITVTAAEAADVIVYDLAGRAVANLTVAAGSSASAALAPGIYIACGTKIIVR